MSSTMASSPTAQLSEPDMDADVVMGDDGATTAAPSSPVSHGYDEHGDSKSRSKAVDFDKDDVFLEHTDVLPTVDAQSRSKEPEEDLQSRLTRLDLLLQRSTVYSKALGERMNKARRDHKAVEVATSSVQNTKVKRGKGTTSQRRKAGSKRGRKDVDEGSDGDGGPSSAKRLKADATAENSDGEPLFRQPDAITGATLKDYQLVGVAWLASLWENGVNGILADEMGLGKTLQTIAFLAYVRQRGAANNTLIVCPLSVLHNWADEFEKFAPSVPVCMYHGTPAERAEIRKTLMVREDDSASPKKGVSSQTVSTPASSPSKKSTSRNAKSNSEGHDTLKSSKGKARKGGAAASSSKTKTRSGTKSTQLPTRRSGRHRPAQVSYVESDALSDQDDAEDDGESAFDAEEKEADEDETDEMDILASSQDPAEHADDHVGDDGHLSEHKQDAPENTFPIVLTTYEMIIKDQKHLSKYKWNFIIVDEGHRLKNMDSRLMQEIKKYDSANRLILTGTPLHNNLAELWSLLNFILPDIFQDLDSFQQWFNLPMLQTALPDEQSNSVISKLHGILKPFLLRRLKVDVEHSLPPKKEYVLYAPLSERQREVYDAVLSGVLRGYLINDKQKEHATPENAKMGQKGRSMRKRANLSYKVDGNDDEWFDRLEQGEFNPQNVRQEDSDAGHRFHYKNTVRQVNSMKLQNTVMQLRKVCSHPFLFDWPSNPVTHEPVVNEQLVNASGKMMVLDRLLDELFLRGHKVLIFSQFTTMLDIIEEWAFSFKRWKTCRIDGSTGPMERRAEMRRFQEGGDDADAPRLFLLSTRAGGLGINLTAADTVIFYDQDWNPQMDLQAMDRAHRIGQTRPVLIFRLISAHTVETKIMQRANEKRKLEALVIAKGKFRMPGSSSGAKGETVAEMAASLLKLEGEKIQVVPNSEAGKVKVISDADLEKLLDRSPEVFEDRREGWTSGAKSTGKTDVAFEVFQAPVDECNDGLAAMMGEKLE